MKVLTLWDADFLGQGNSGTVVILVNNDHCQCRRASQSWTSSISCCNYQPVGGQKTELRVMRATHKVMKM